MKNKNKRKQDKPIYKENIAFESLTKIIGKGLKRDNETLNLATRATLIGDSAQYYNPKNNILVEGKKDENFYSQFSSNNSFILADQLNQDKDLNNKAIIKKTLTSIFHTNDLQKYKLYGIVDRDFDDEYPSQLKPREERILSDKAHDLEMIMFSTDDKLLETINLPNDEIVNKAFYMAYQIACVKKYLVGEMHYRIPKELDFDKFFDGINLILNKYFSYINKVADATHKAKFEDVIKKMQRLHYIDKQQNFKISFVDFKAEEYYEFISGHDFLNLLLYLWNKINPNHQLTEDKLFIKILNNYNKNCFSKSTLYGKLNANRLI